MPRYNKEFTQKHKTYIMVVGGAGVEQCVRLNDKAKQFLKDVYSEDVDIKMVVEDPEHTDIDAIDQLRRTFMKDIQKRVSRYVHRNKNPKLPTAIVTDTSLLNHKVDVIRDSRVVSLIIKYNVGPHVIEYPLLDTTIMMPKHRPYFFKYKDAMHTKRAVPYYKVNGINYMSCEYLLFDNIRMLIDRAKFLKKTQSVFALLKFTKYVIKFMSLYVLRRKLKDLPPELLQVYHEAYVKLKEVDTMKLKDGFKNLHKIKYSEEEIDHMVSHLDKILKAYNMKTLIKAAGPLPKKKNA